MKDKAGKHIQVKCDFDMLGVKRPILSVSKLCNQGFNVHLDSGNGGWIEKGGKKVELEQLAGVYLLAGYMHEKLLYTFEGAPTQGEGGPEHAVEEAAPAWARRLPHQPSAEERASHRVTHLPFRVWCAECVA